MLRGWDDDWRPKKKRSNQGNDDGLIYMHARYIEKQSIEDENAHHCFIINWWPWSSSYAQKRLWEAKKKQQQQLTHAHRRAAAATDCY